ncbi:MAG: DNA adenine methylase [Prevotella sp.]|nr:DNA adenine methylase [Prevotella sp.]
MKPMIKYRGGKSKEIPQIMWHIPRFSGRYVEPFFGGGALYFYLEPREAIINDINKQLINFYKGVRDDFPKLRKELDEIEAVYEANRRDYEVLKEKVPFERVEDKNETLYYLLRDMFNNKINKEYSDALLYYFINKTAYSGMIRYNADGEFNVPYGRYKHLSTQQISSSHSKLLRRTEIYNVDYSKIFNMCNENDFVFLDPPYDCTFSDYGNVEYKDGFNEESHRRLAEDFRNLPCKALMVIGKTPLTEELYAQFIVDKYEKIYAVNIRNRFKSEAKHIVVANYKKDWTNIQVFAPETNNEYAIPETSQVMLFESKKKYHVKNK